MTQLPRLAGATGRNRKRSPEAVGRADASVLPWEALEVPAANMESGVDEEVKAADPEIPEADALGVPQQPGGLVIRGLCPLFQ